MDEIVADDLPVFDIGVDHRGSRDRSHRGRGSRAPRVGPLETMAQAPARHTGESQPLVFPLPMIETACSRGPSMAAFAPAMPGRRDTSFAFAALCDAGRMRKGWCAPASN